MNDAWRWLAWLLAVLVLFWSAAPVARAFIPLGERTTLVPLPEIIVDPNEGETVGVLTTVLFSDEQDQLRRIFAPDVRYNENTGVYPSLRLYEYPAPNQTLFLQAGKATKIGEYFEALYNGDGLFDGWIDARLRLFHENDPFERFYGIGNDTSDSEETNYTGDTGLVLGYMGVHLPFNLRVGTQTRLKVVRVREGGVDSVTQLVDSPLATTKGADGSTIVGQAFNFGYDTRDSPSIPTEGVFGDAAVDIVDEALGSSSSYLRYSVEGRGFLPLSKDKRFVLAGQTLLSYMEGGNRAPFYDRNPLGGMRSLRGFGSNRFIDNHRFFARTELRTNIWEPVWLVERFKVHGHLEAAPFVEVGRVFHDSHTFPLEDAHVDGGLGLRAILPPQLVAFVDVGTDGGGASVFTGVDYPF